MSISRYSILVVSIVLATLALAWPLALVRLDAGARWAVAFGGAIAVVNTSVAHGLVRWSAGRSTGACLRAVLGGMLGRMAFMLGAVLAGILLLGMPRLPLAVSLLSYFALFLFLELSMLPRPAGTSAGGPR